MKFQPKIFSVEEANALIPELEVLLECLQGKRKACEQLHDMLLMDELLKEAEFSRGTSSAARSLEEEALRFEGAILEVQAEIEKIRSFGCIPRNLERGWIDFQGQWKGRTVYFCWRRGEKTIQFYSSDSAGAERLPLA